MARSSPAPTSIRNTGLASSVAQRIASEKLIKFGKASFVSSFTSIPQSKKEWTGYTKKQHREIRKRTKSNPMSQRRVSGRKFDYRPDHWKSGRKHRHFGMSAQDRHQRRMPLKGKYSRPDKVTTKIHQIKMRRLGIASYGLGKTMRGLGYLGLAYTAYDVYDRGPTAVITDHLGGKPVVRSSNLFADMGQTFGKHIFQRHLF